MSFIAKTAVDDSMAVFNKQLYLIYDEKEK